MKVLDIIERELRIKLGPVSAKRIKNQIDRNFISEKKMWKAIKHNVKCYNIEVLKIIDKCKIYNNEDIGNLIHKKELKQKINQRLKEVVK